jgi:hypothetical protein
MTLTVSEASRAYREKRKAKLQRLAAYEAALREIAGASPFSASVALITIAEEALAADRFELENGA